MKLAQFSVKNSLLVNLISAFIIIVGIYSMFNIRRELFPPVAFDTVTVTTTYPGAPAEDVEKFVTIPIEKEIRGISGVQEIASSSEEGLSSIGVEIDPSATDKDKVVDDVRNAVDRVNDLPDDASDPVVFELDSKEFPILEISISGDVSELTRRQYAESLEDQLKDVSGVASVNRIGWRDRQFWVEVVPEKLKAYHVSIEEIMNALSSRNIAMPGGSLTTDVDEYNIRITGEFAEPEEVMDVIIRANDSGNWLRVKDVANVIDTFEDESTIAKINGQRSTSMVVVKNEMGDTLNIAEKLKAIIENFKRTLPKGMEITISNDYSYYVERRLNVLKNNGLVGFFLVLVILFLFLDPIPAFMTAVGIPIALCITFTMMSIMGMSINMVTMLGLIIVLGMLVDDGIVVSENVYRHIENGMPVKKAAISGTSQVIIPVTVTILTTCCAFSPLMFMKDLLGKFIRQIPMVVMIALAASLLESFIILPSHLSDFVKSIHNNAKNKIATVKDKAWFIALINVYTKCLKICLRFRYLVLLIMVMIFFMAIGLIKSKVVKVVMFQGEGIEQFFVRAEASKGVSLDKINEMMAPVEEMVSKIPGNELDSYRTYLGAIEEEGGFDPNAKHGSHLGQITIFLSPIQDRKRTAQEIIKDLRPELERLEKDANFEKLYFYLPKEGPPTGHPVEVAIIGDDFDVLQKLSEQFKSFLAGVKGVSDVSIGLDEGKKQLRVVVDEQKAKKYYLTISQIALSVRNAFNGGVATSIKPLKAEEEIDVLVRFSEDQRKDMKAFDKLLVQNSKGNLVPLKSVAYIEETEGIANINHLDGKRVVMVTAQVDNKNTTSLEVNMMLQEHFKDIAKDNLGYTVKYSGEFEEQMKSAKNLGMSFLFACFAIFIILVAMFGSLVQPFIIVSVIPFGIVGVILAFWGHGRPLSFFSFMGMVGLTGIVVNDSIVLVDFINGLRKSGKEKMLSIIEAGQTRLRPIIMTTVTTIGGLVSVAYGIGGGDPFLKPMGLAIIWGLALGTLLTLLGIPCLYAIFDDITEKVFRHHMVKVDEGKS